MTINFFTETLANYLNWTSLVFLVEAYLCLALGKVIYLKFFYDRKGLSESWSHELFEKDNPALAVSLVGYLFGVGLVILGVLTGESEAEWIVINPFFSEVLEVALWSLVGILLLNLARLVNDKFILSRFSNQKEILTDRNVGTAMVQFGSYVGAALLIHAILSYSEASWWDSLLSVLLYFVMGQVGFVLFAKFYVKVLRYDFHAELEKDNAAVGTALGLNLVAIGILLSFPLEQTQSLWVFVLSFFNGTLLLLFSRWLLDKTLFHKANLDKEIAEDRNWGLAIIEGGLALAIAFLINGAFGF